MEKILYQNQFVRVEIEPFEIPWLKIFTIEPYKEFSQCSYSLKLEILKMLDFLEKEMIYTFNPDKINIASFGNYVPHLHFHIQARFKNDSFFPEPTWGKKMREGELQLDLDRFYKHLEEKLEREKI
ncbi:MAG: HIT family protein [Arcobacteraceae bacterium]|nr:HIT family protein [Arcobacteraceae bacterium]